ncbi:MAG: MFS transporter, partial [Parvibaculaceae bacterium]
AVDLVLMLALFTVLEATEAGFSLILALVALLAATRAFYWPAAAALAPTLVPREQFSAASACSSATWQLTVIVGPVLGGLLYGISLYAAQAVAMSMAVAALLLAFLIEARRPERSGERQSIASLVGGFRHVFNNRLILGAVSLDLFVVFLGGAMALMPIFAQDILVLDPWGLGLLRSGIGIGAICMAIVLGIWPIRRHAGPLLFAAIGGFGAATLLFGLSTTPWLSILALMFMGAADMVSVVIRDVLTQVWTPDYLRGRVNAAVMIFINASNELGDFRAGSMASLIGPVPTVLFGGVGIFVTLLIYIAAFPTLRKADDLHKGLD